MENWMNECISVASILRWIDKHYLLLFVGYVVSAVIRGGCITRKWAAEQSDVNPDVVTLVLFVTALAPVWLPVYVMWHWLDLGGRKLRAERERKADRS